MNGTVKKEKWLRRVYFWVQIVVFNFFLIIIPTGGPIITKDQLTSLPLVKVVPHGQYSGSKLNSVVRMMRGLLEQKVPLQEFEVKL